MSRKHFDYIKGWLALTALLAVGVPLLLALRRFAYLRAAADADVIYQNIYINGVPVGGLSREEAAAALEMRFLPPLAGKSVDLIGGGAEFNIKFSEIAGRYDFTDLIDEAWRYTREGGQSERYLRIKALRVLSHEINAPPRFVYDASLLENALSKASERFDAPPVDARLSWDGHGVVIISEIAGRAADVGAAREAVAALLADIDNTYPPESVKLSAALNFYPVAPACARADLDFPITRLGGYETPYQSGPDARAVNLEVAAAKLNNIMLRPGEGFSALAALGPITREGGYKRATVLVNGVPMYDYGGGVCQSVTTLYNAALYAELKITQRHNHSAKVSYADYAFDATVAGDYYDFKFTNSTPEPLLIVCEMKDSRFITHIYGFETRPPGRGLSFKAELTETIGPPPDELRRDDSLARGEYVVTVRPQEGRTYVLWKYIYQNGVLTGREKVGTSVYKPVRGVVYTGD